MHLVGTESYIGYLRYIRFKELKAIQLPDVLRAIAAFVSRLIQHVNKLYIVSSVCYLLLSDFVWLL
jgi:hypothetical protein